MDKILARYPWNTMFNDFQEDVLDIGYAIDTDDKKTINARLKDMQTIHDDIAKSSIRRSKSVRYLATTFMVYTKDVKHDIETRDTNDINDQVDYLDNYTGNGWKQQVSFNAPDEA